MAFPRARIRRFNEETGCAPGVGHYEPKFLSRSNSITLDKSERFKDPKSGDLGLSYISFRNTFKSSFTSLTKKNVTQKRRSFSCSVEDVATSEAYNDTLALLERLKKEINEKDLLIRKLQNELTMLSQAKHAEPEEPSGSHDKLAFCSSLLDAICLSPFKRKIKLSSLPKFETNNTEENKQPIAINLNSVEQEAKSTVSSDKFADMPSIKISSMEKSFELIKKDNLELSQENLKVMISKETTVKRLSDVDNDLFQLEQLAIGQQQKLDEKIDECISLNERLSNQCFELESTKKSLNYLEGQLQFLTKEVEELRDEKALLESNLEEERQLVICEKAKAAEKEKEADELAQKLISLVSVQSERQMSYEDAIQKSNNELEELGCQLKQTEVELKAAQDLVEELKMLNSELSQSNKALSQEVTHWSSAFGTLNAEFEELNLTTNQLNGKLVEANNEIERLNSCIVEASKQKDVLQAQLVAVQEDKERGMDHVIKENQRLNAELEKREVFVSQTQELHLQTEHFRFQIYELEKMVNKVNGLYSNVVEDLVSLQARSQHQVEVIQKIKEEKATTELELQTLRQDSQAEIQNLKDVITENERQIAKLDEELQERHSELVQMKNADLMAKDLNIKKDFLESQLLEASLLIDDLNKEQIRFEASFNELSAENSKLQAKLKVQGDLKKAIREKEAAEQRFQATLQDNQSEIESLRDIISGLETEKIVLEKELEERIKEIGQNKNIVLSLQETLDDIEPLKKELEDKVFELQQQSNDNELSWQTKYKDLEDYIEPYKDIIDKFMVEKDIITMQKDDAYSQLSAVSSEFAKAMGHQNHRQKIKYVSKLTDENLELKRENARLRETNYKQQLALQKYQGDTTPRKSVKASASKTPAKEFPLPPPQLPASVLKAKENLQQAYF